MSLPSGAKLGPYEIVGTMGSGGMGEVYRARDSRLGREVALKILPANVACDADRLRRFDQEARSASALKHPNIVTIYELGEAAGTQYLAMELVEGKTLREKLAGGALPLRLAIQIACQLADGLAKAHEAGIVHRDIKPENVIMSADGQVKILDFGLAKLFVSAQGASDTPTIMTRAGSIVGTVHYMSPEQASAGELDHRSDQFSFGLLLYEMVTGRRAFHRQTDAETMVAILREDHEPANALNSEAPAPLCWIIDRCLAKEPQQRYASTRDLAGELANLRAHISELQAKHMEPLASNLPAQRTRFVGRSDEVESVRHLLLRPEVRLVTITGPGGIGKTRLALQVAASLADAFPAGIGFVSLAAITDGGMIPAVVAQALGIRESAGKSPADNLQLHLRHTLRSPLLLLLDNFEHLSDAAPVLSDFLSSGSKLKILVTSRSALHLYGEHEFPVPPLSLPSVSGLKAQDLSRHSAIALFVERAAAVKPGFALTDENAGVVMEICRSLDGLPLAIELAAARMKFLTAGTLQSRLAGRLQLLTGGARDLPARQQTLRATIDWSHSLLSEPEQKLFRRLSAFVGGCTIEAAEAVCNTNSDLGMDLLDGLSSLVDKNLARQAEHPGGEPRFVMLETIRDYGLEKLAASSERAAVFRAHAAYFLVLAEEAASGDEDVVTWLEQLDAEYDNLRCALEWLTENREVEWGLRLGAALFRYWERREYLAEGRSRLAKLLALNESQRTKTRARALFAAGVLAGEQRDYPAADALLADSLEIARQAEDKRGIAVCLNARAVYSRDFGSFALARALFEEALVLWREIADERLVARALSNLASVLKLQSEFDRADSLYDECLGIFSEIGDQAGIAWSLAYKGDVARSRGDSAAARERYSESLRTFQTVGEKFGIASTLADLGNLARDQGETAAAYSLYEESLKSFRELRHQRGVARVLECFASSAARSRPEDALRIAAAAAALRASIGAPLTAAERAELDPFLQCARAAVGSSGGSAAWLEGWSLAVEDAIELALLLRAASSTGAHGGAPVASAATEPRP